MNDEYSAWLNDIRDFGIGILVAIALVIIIGIPVIVMFVFLNWLWPVITPIIIWLPIIFVVGWLLSLHKLAVAIWHSIQRKFGYG